MSGDLDFSELAAFSNVMAGVERDMIPNARKNVEFAARESKDVWQGAARGPSGRHARRYPGSIDYTMQLDTDGSIGAEVGPNINRSQGSLGFLDEGGGGVAAAPQHAGRKAAKVAEKELEIGALKALKGLD